MKALNTKLDYYHLKLNQGECKADVMTEFSNFFDENKANMLSCEILENEADDNELIVINSWEPDNSETHHKLIDPQNFSYKASDVENFILCDRYIKEKMVSNRTHQPVEHLVFNIKDESKVTEFIELDKKMWTGYLSAFDGFVSKEVWLNPNNKNEINTILYWDNLECWKSIPIEELIETDTKFQQKFSHKFEMAREIHKEFDHKLFRTQLFTKEV